MKNPITRRFTSLLLALALAAALAVPAAAVEETDPPETTPPTENNTTTTPLATSHGDTLTLATQAQTHYAGVGQNKDLQAPKATVTNQDGQDVTGSYTLSYLWSLGDITGPSIRFTPVETGTDKLSCTITATPKEGDGKPLTGKCTYTIQILPATAVGATLEVGAGAQTLLELKDLKGEQNILEQLLLGGGGDELDGAVAIPGLSKVVFDMGSVGGSAVGSLTAANGVPYFAADEADGDKLAQVVFLPAATGTYSVNFLAYGETTDGSEVEEVVYYGRLEIVVTPDRDPDQDETPIDCDSAGFSFSGSDFYDSAAQDPVVAVRFGTPSAGVLLRSLTKAPDAQTATYYTNSAADGKYHISTLFYLPAPGYSGLATLPATCITRSGTQLTRTIQVNVESKNASEHFTDVTADGVGSWAANSVDFAMARGLVGGTGEGKFSPDDPMTRAMLVTVLYRAAGSPKVEVTSNFTDLDDEGYYYDAVIWAGYKGIVNGTSGTTFSPNQAINRQQIATILHRYANVVDGESGESNPSSLDSFQDKNKVDEYARTGMCWAVQKGIVSGTTSTTLSPKAQATRAQVVVMLHRYLAN